MKDLISIILPVYNGEEYLEECLESLINQTYSNIEILIINDGSTDNSFNIMKKYINKDKRIIIIDKKNEGVSISRNIGISQSKGKYITFIDADDWIEQDAIEKLVYKIKELQVDAIRYNCYINKKYNIEKASLYNLKNKLVRSSNILDSKITEHFLCVQEPIANFVMLLFVKADIIRNKINFYKHLYMMEDVVFYQELFQKLDTLYFWDETLYHYRYNDNSVTKSYNQYERNIYGIIEVNRILTEILSKRESKENDKLIKKMNANQLKIISNYIAGLTKLKGFSVNTLMEVLSKNMYYNNMLKNCLLNDIPFKNKCMIHVFRLNSKLINEVFLKILGMFYKVKGESV